mgnify:FL=1
MNERILVLSQDAEDYLPLLGGLTGSGATLLAASTTDEAIHAGARFQVILAQPDLLAAAPALLDEARWVQSTWAGITPLLRLGRTDYLLSGVKNVFGQQMAEFVLAYLLAHEMKLLERLGRQVNRSWWQEPTGTLEGKVLGVLGTGSIGQEIALRLQPFGVKVAGLSRSGTAVEGFDHVYGPDQLQDFLSFPDYLVCTLPDTEETAGLLDRKAFNLVKPGTYLVNVGRGSVLDEEALVEALKSGQLSGAALDVFQEEPLPPESHLWHAENLLITAHVAASSWPRDIARIFLENYRRYTAGRDLLHQIDFNRGY